MIINIVNVQIKSAYFSLLFMFYVVVFSNPENVMLCVLPQATFESDVTIHMQHTLIEAYCWENDITVLKVRHIFFDPSREF